MTAFLLILAKISINTYGSITVRRSCKILQTSLCQATCWILQLSKEKISNCMTETFSMIPYNK